MKKVINIVLVVFLVIMVILNIIQYREIKELRYEVLEAEELNIKITGNEEEDKEKEIGPIEALSQILSNSKYDNTFIFEFLLY